MGPPQAQEEFLDGGLGANNPTRRMMRETYETFKQSRGVACVVSIGTGLKDVSEIKKPTFSEKVFPKELIGALKDMVTDCQVVESEVSRWFTHKPGIYFRFNVEKGLENINLEESKELGNIKSKTIRYLEQDETTKSVREAVSVLCNPKAQVLVSELSI